MAYSDFTLAAVKEQFDLSFIETESLFSAVEESPYSNHLKETLDYNIPLALSINTEKARSELIVAPVLVEIIKQFNRQISLFSGTSFDVDKARGLNGVCDFIISLSPEQLIVDAPLITVVEAKNDNLKAGLGQCSAEMLAAMMYNENKQASVHHIYGVVTTGSLWNFLKLKENKLWIDNEEYHISNSGKIIGILKSMINIKD